MNTKDMFDLAGTTALVTGASRGLGLGIAKGLADFGADIVLVARKPEALASAAAEIETRGVTAYRYSHDLADTGGLPGLFRTASKDAGGIDVLVNNAGVNRRGPAEEVTDDDWDLIHTVNLKSAAVLSRAFAKECIAKRRGGKIINVTSLLTEAARPGISTYAASKGGLKLLTKSCAVEWGKYGINVNAIGPGYYATDMNKALTEDPEFDAWVRGKAPLGRWGRPADLAGAAVFLASAASDFMTGQTVFVDGGWLANL